MTFIFDYRVSLLLLVFWQTDANLNIVQTGTKTGATSFECGTRLVLTCQIDVYSFSMSWQNDSSPTPLAECVGSGCTLDDSVAGLYEISANTTAGIFNLTIIHVTLKNNGTSYICGDGSTSVSSLIIVKDYEPTLNESTPGIVEVTSGCIDNSTDVTFNWKIIKKAYLKKENNYQDFQPPNIKCSTNICLGDTNCEPSHFVKRSCFIEVEPGGDYHIRAVLSYDGYEKSALTTGTFKIYDGGSQCSIKCDTVCRLLIVIGVFLFMAVIVGCLLLYVMLILWQTKKGDCKEDKRETSHIEIILNTVSAILWIVIVILFICSLLYCCSCDDPCCCCKSVLIFLYIIGVLFGIHVFLWLLLLYVLNKRKDKEYKEGNIYCKTKLMKVRIVSSTIPMVGFFPVCGWLIRIYRYGNRTIRDKVTSEKKTRDLPSIPERIVTLNKTEDKKNKSQKKVKKEQNKINELLKQTIESSEDREEKVNEDQLSASEITIVKPKVTYIKSNANIQKSPDAKSTLTQSVTKQQSQNNRNVLTRSQDHTEEHEKNIPDNQNLGPHSDENLQRKIDVTTKQSVSKKKSDSKDEVKPRKKKPRKQTDENKSTKITEFIITDVPTGNTQVTKRGYDDPPDSGDDDRPSNISKSDKAVPNRKKSRENKEEKEGPNNTKLLSAESHNGSEPMKRALSANFDDKYDATTTVSIDSDTKM